MTLALLSPALSLAALAAGGGGTAPTPVPSSHREAPLITELPKVDATDFYMFNSYEPGREDYVILVANYLPLQDGYGGPNYFSLDPQARYEISIDNDGDAKEDLCFRFGFNSFLRDIALPIGPAGNRKTVSIPLSFIGPVDENDNSANNVVEWYQAGVVIEDAGGNVSNHRLINANSGDFRFIKPMDNVGNKTIADYPAYADAHMYDISLPGGLSGRMFVGQRADPFVVNLGEIFDLINLDPLGAPDAKENTLADKNVTSIVLEIPKDFLTAGNGPVIGAWTSAWLPKQRVLALDPTFEDPELVSGGLRQVSRLGAPLVNEVVIGLKDKNRFNASQPENDAQFLDYVTHPTLPAIIEVLFGVPAPTLFPRNDLVAIFLTGVPGLNVNGSVGEMLRLNTDIAAIPAAQQDRLGVIGGDLAGFPNGRRPGDDVVDIALRSVMGVLLDPADAPGGQLPFTDGAIISATDFPSAFPFLNEPYPGSPQ